MTKYETLLAAEEATGERALEALDRAHELLQWIAQPGQGDKAAAMHLRAYTAYNASLPASDWSRKQADAMQPSWLSNLYAMVDSPFTVWVTPRMVALATAIADEGIDLPLLPFDPPAKAGCFMLASPLMLDDYGREPGSSNLVLPITVLGWTHEIVRTSLTRSDADEGVMVFGDHGVQQAMRDNGVSEADVQRSHHGRRRH
jgi:hypothetical protein